ncbi:MAG: ATP-binding cassette domain-containing protein [Deltaproteobacteria bacterium]|nr:ATP-binding cassette domain-containing protein [Deltaproteobacteria bacterium]
MCNNLNPHTGEFHVDGLSKRFGRYQALSDISFSLLPGEILGLIGPNGAGKSTLLECITGLLPVGSGTINWQGHPEFSVSIMRDLLPVFKEELTPSVCEESVQSLENAGPDNLLVAQWIVNFILQPGSF